MDGLTDYSHAIAALALYGMLALILNPVAGLTRARAGLEPGEMPSPDYNNRSYRVCRSYQNTVEMAGVFAVVVSAAIFAGVSPSLVNWLASLSLLFRVVMIYVHIQGVGAPENGARTIIFVLCWLCKLALAVLAVVAAF